jgi:hypothetical protein
MQFHIAHYMAHIDGATCVTGIMYTGWSSIDKERPEVCRSTL